MDPNVALNPHNVAMRPGTASFAQAADFSNVSGAQGGRYARSAGTQGFGDLGLEMS